MAVCDAVRAAIESTYKDKCTVTEIQHRRNPETFLEEEQEVCTVEEKPCRLSFSSISAVSDGDYAKTAQTVKLFIAPEVKIKAGSKITIVQENGSTHHYKRSGVAGVYSTHQEIMLELFEKWA